MHQKLPAEEPAAVKAKAAAMANPLHPHPPANKPADASRRPPIHVPPLNHPPKTNGPASREGSAEPRVSLPLHQKTQPPTAETAAVKAKASPRTHTLQPHPPATKPADASRRPLVPPLNIPANTHGTPSRESSAERSKSRLHDATESSKNKQLAAVSTRPRSATPSGSAASSRSVTPNTTPRATSTTTVHPGQTHVTKQAWGPADKPPAAQLKHDTKPLAVDKLKPHAPATTKRPPAPRDPKQAWPSLTDPPADKVHPLSARKVVGTAKPTGPPRSAGVGRITGTHVKPATSSLRPSSADSRTPAATPASILRGSSMPSMPGKALSHVTMQRGESVREIPARPATPTTPRNHPPKKPPKSGKPKNDVVGKLMQQASQAGSKKPFGTDFHNRKPVKDPHPGTKQTNAKKKR